MMEERSDAYLNDLPMDGNFSKSLVCGLPELGTVSLTVNNL